jgi:tripartite-type tricarboxylate transporter receptor subunit TctC
MPDVPTTEEAGYPNLEATAWFGMVAPAKTPEATLAQIIAALRATLAMPDIKAKLIAQGLYPFEMCGAEFRSHLQRQYEIYGRIIKDANIKG